MLLLLLGIVTARLFRLKGAEAAVFRHIRCSGIPNFWISPDNGTIWCGRTSLCQYVPARFLSFTVDGWCCNSEPRERDYSEAKPERVLNPNTIATFAGLTCFLLSFKLPDIFTQTMTELGSANTWLSMLNIGAMLVFFKTGSLLKNKELYIVSFNRLITDRSSLS